MCFNSQLCSCTTCAGLIRADGLMWPLQVVTICGSPCEQLNASESELSCSMARSIECLKDVKEPVSNLRAMASTHFRF